MSLTPGLVKTPLVGSDSRVTNEWAKFFEALSTFDTTADGSATGLTAADIARISAIESSLAALLLRLRALELGVQM